MKDVTIEDELLALERRFWTGGAAFYREHLADDVVMVFPGPGGTLTRTEIVASIETAPRWDDVAIDGVRSAALTGDVALLTYLATGTRGGASEPYVARASSVYVRERGAWRLAFHQQTPVPHHAPHAPDKLAM